VQSTTSNILLAGLGAASRASLLGDAETVMLESGRPLYRPDDVIAHAYFPVGAAIALSIRDTGARTPTVGVIGREGMLGLELVFDVPKAEILAVVQCSGSAMRVARAPFNRQLRDHPALLSRLKRYAFVRLLQLSRDVCCHDRHLVEKRLACQLLLARDRTGSDVIPMTHETLASVLGVRRAGVTLAASVLRASGLIRYSRGSIDLLNLGGLEVSACDCYATGKRVYERLLAAGRLPE